MKLEVRYSKSAIRDLDRIWGEVFAVSKSFDTTERYIDELMDKIEGESDFPQSGSPLYYENSFTGYYFIVYKTYLAFYRINKNEMLVDRILYGRSDNLKHLHIDFEI